jgi:hypothetical protein
MSPATSTRAEQTAITSRFDAGWRVNGTLRTPVSWPNAQFTPPDNAAWCELRVNRQGAFNAAFTATDKLIRHPGLVTVDIRVPINQGDRAALDLADVAAGIFRNVTTDGITFRAPTVRDFGADGPWYRVQVDCPYWRDSIHTHD